MSEPDDYKLDEVYLAHGFRAETVHSESSTGEFGSRGNPLQGNGHEPPGRVMGSPLPMGSPLGSSQEAQSHRAAVPPGRSTCTGPGG